ncbi:uncharacterized protein METZ01_LOCUS55818 [marine metagenome]|uniref:Uncharacterized protein n=1 Tax=marine metagenome TaxID=408172 RepID=A0A381SHL2_9ZZZZ
MDYCFNTISIVVFIFNSYKIIGNHDQIYEQIET